MVIWSNFVHVVLLCLPEMLQKVVQVLVGQLVDFVEVGRVLGDKDALLIVFESVVLAWVERGVILS